MIPQNLIDKRDNEPVAQKATAHETPVMAPAKSAARMVVAVAGIVVMIATNLQQAQGVGLTYAPHTARHAP